MKNLIYKFRKPIGIICFSCFLISFIQPIQEQKKNVAEVNQQQGLYLFVDSKPVMQYDYIGTVKATIGWDSQYEGVRNKLIDKCKKEFPQAEGIIFSFKSGGVDHADAIKFK